MSYCGFAEPNSVPLTVFPNSTISSADRWMARSVKSPVSPTTTTVPPLPIAPNADDTTSSWTSPTVISA